MSAQPLGQQLILGHTALAAGLGLDSPPAARQALSQLLHTAISGGPGLIVPALCLAAAARERAGLAEHVAALLAQAPPAAIEVRGLTRDARLDAARALLPGRSWPVLPSGSGRRRGCRRTGPRACRPGTSAGR